MRHVSLQMWMNVIFIFSIFYKAIFSCFAWNKDYQTLFIIFLNEDFITKSTQTTLLTKYIHICTSHHQLHIQTLHIIQNEVLTMVKKHLSNGQLSRKVFQLLYLGCPRIMQIYLVYRIAMGLYNYRLVCWSNWLLT